VFGFLWALFVGGAAIKDSIDNDVEKNTNRYNAVKDGKDIYYDGRANIYCVNDCGSDTQCIRITDLNTGHEVLKSVKDGTIIKDYTLEALIQMDIDFEKKKQELKKEAIKNGKKYYHVSGIYFPRDCRKAINGNKYKTDFSHRPDRRCKVNYLVDGDIAYTLDEINCGQGSENLYYINYYEVDKFYAKMIKSERITKDIYYELGCWIGRSNPNSY
jgi:hypothetical protein